MVSLSGTEEQAGRDCTPDTTTCLSSEVDVEA